MVAVSKRNLTAASSIPTDPTEVVSARARLASGAAWMSRLGFAVALVTLAWRWRVLLLARPQPGIYRDYTDFLLFPSDLAVAVTLAAWIITVVAGRQRIRLGPAILTVPLAGLIASGWWSIAFSWDPVGSFYHSVRLLLLGGLYLYLVNTRIQGSWIVVPVGLMAGVQAVVGLGQVLEQRSLGLQGLGEYELDPAWAGVSVVVSEGSRLLRAYGLSDHPNILGGCLALAALVLGGGFLATSRWRALLGLGFGLSLAGLFLTFSRAAALAFAVGFAFLVWRAWRSRAQSWRRGILILIAIGAAVALPLGMLYGNALAGRLGAQNSFQSTFVERRSLEERGALNEAANHIFAEHPLTGVGLGALVLAMEARYPVFGYYYQPAHLVLLDVAAETGLIGAAFYLLAVASPWLTLAFRPRRASVSLPLIVASSALAAITVISFLDYYPWLLNPGRLMLWSIWGVWGRLYGDLSERSNG